ncbi:MAG: NYN domain-containing protein, partial [Defluviitaleaceae bacterium]|nr:NYN domain-containing protein [Defluviitaleaceae bacterium]
VEEYHNIMIVFTREAETADRYIERTAQRLARRDSVTVATSDRLEQLIIIGQGACRISARELLQSIERAKKALRERYARTRPLKRNPIEQLLDPDTAKKLDEMRYNRK